MANAEEIKKKMADNLGVNPDDLDYITDEYVNQSQRDAERLDIPRGPKRKYYGNHLIDNGVELIWKYMPNECGMDKTVKAPNYGFESYSIVSMCPQGYHLYEMVSRYSAIVENITFKVNWGKLDDGTLAPIKVEGIALEKDNGTVKDVMDKIASNTQTPFTYTVTHFSFGDFLEAINGKPAIKDPGYFWQLSINDEPVKDCGMSTCAVSNGDIISWDYVQYIPGDNVTPDKTEL